MDDIKAILMWTINTTIPENLLAWDVDAFIGLVVDNNAPTLGHLLHVAAERRENNKFTSCTTV